LRLEELGTQHFNYHFSKLILGFRPAFLILSSEQVLEENAIYLNFLKTSQYAS